jgi:HEAT repeat protein
MLARVARSGESGNVARAAAVRAIGMLGARGENEVLAELSRAPDRTLRASAVLALAELRAPEAPDAIAEALIDQDPELRSAAALAALAYATGSYRRPSDPLSPPDARVDLGAVLAALRPGPYTPKERVETLEKLAPAIAHASTTVALSSPERARAVVEALGLTRGDSPLPALVGNVEGTERARVDRALAPVAAALVPALTALTRHPYAPIRVTAVDFLGERSEPEARAALLERVGDGDPSVRRAVLATLESSDPEMVAAVAARLSVEDDWGIRVAITKALGRAGKGAPEVTTLALSRALWKDDYALVREAAARALHAVDPNAARPHLERLKRHDPEPRVREAAWKLIGGPP